MENPITIEQLCELFLQTVNKYNQLENEIHQYDVTPRLYLSEIHTIAAIGAHENINITNLARLQGVTKSAVSQTVSRLVKKDYVQKAISPDAENEVLLLLTKKGKTIFIEHNKQHQWLKEQLITIFAEYPQDTMHILADLSIHIQKMWDNYQKN